MDQGSRDDRKVMRIMTPEEADRADREDYAALTPAERLAIQAELIWRAHGTPPRLERILTVAQLPRR